jgi:hypothetical protein
VGTNRTHKKRPGAMKPQVRTGAPPGTRTPNPRIKSPLLCSRFPRYYLHLHARTSEDMLLPWEKEYQIRTTATGLYRRIRASTEPARDRIGLDQTHETRQSWPRISARRTARGNTECDRQCRSPMTASLSRARSWSVAMRRGGDGLGPDVYPCYTCRVPRMTCGLPRGRWVRRPLQEAARQKSRVQFCTPQGFSGMDPSKHRLLPHLGTAEIRPVRLRQGTTGNCLGALRLARDISAPACWRSR